MVALVDQLAHRLVEPRRGIHRGRFEDRPALLGVFDRLDQPLPLEGVEDPRRLFLGVLVVQLAAGPKLLGTEVDHGLDHLQGRGVGGRIGAARFAHDHARPRGTPQQRIAGLEVVGRLGHRGPRDGDRHVEEASLVQGRHELDADLGEVVGRQGQGHQARKRQQLPAEAHGEGDRSEHRDRHDGQEAGGQGSPTTASSGNRPAPAISRAENDHIARLRRGISQVSQRFVDVDQVADQPAILFAPQPAPDEGRNQGRHQRDREHRHADHGETLGEGQGAEHLALAAAQREHRNERDQDDHHREEDRPADRAAGRDDDLARVAGDFWRWPKWAVR